MQQYALPLRDSLLAGLRAEAEIPRPGLGLSSVTGLIPKPWGLVQGILPSNPYDSTGLISTSQYNQIIPLRGQLAVVTADNPQKIYAFYPPAGTVSGSDLASGLKDIDGDSVSLPQYSYWSAASLGKVTIASNASMLLFDLPHITQEVALGGGLFAADVTLNNAKPMCIGAYKNRFFYCGLNDSFAATKPALDDLIRLLKQYSGIGTTVGESLIESYASARDWILYGEVDGGGMDLPILCELGVLTGYWTDETYNLIKDAIRKRQIGLLRNPFIGSTIYCCKELGEQLAIYSDMGISLISLQRDGIPAIEGFLPIPVSHRAAVTGNRLKHVFFDSKGDVWVWVVGSAPRRLGYKEFLSSFPSATYVRACYDSNRDEAYFTKLGTTSVNFVLTESGLGSGQHSIGSLTNSTSYNYGYYQSAAATFSATIIVKDCSRRAVKMLQEVDIETIGGTGITCQVSTKMGENESWKTGHTKQCSKEGVAFPMIQGVDFKITIAGTLTSGFALQNALLKWQGSDLRFIRGLIPEGQQYANQGSW